MDGILKHMASMYDTAGLVLGIVFYLLCAVVFLLRAYEKTEQELRLKYVFSLQLVPFSILFIVNLVSQGRIRHAVTLAPMLMFLGYDLWYRALTEKKPVHHPDKWPKLLIVYLVLMFAGSIGLNWYGYLASEQYGTVLLAGFFVMMGAYSLYQVKHNKRKQTKQ